MALSTVSASSHKRKATCLSENILPPGPSSVPGAIGEGTPAKKLRALCDVEEQIVNDTQLSDTVSSLNAISNFGNNNTLAEDDDGTVHYFSLLPFELKLLIAETCPQSWVLCSLVFRDVGLYSMRDYVQKRMRSKFRHIFIKKFKDYHLIDLINQNLDEIAVYIIEDGSIDINAPLDGTTALHYAAEVGKDVIVERLIVNGGELNSVDEPHFCTPLHWAAISGGPNVADILLKHKALLEVRNSYSNTPLHSAVFHGNTPVLKLLIVNGSDIEAKGNIGFTPLIMAAEKGRKDILTFLIDKGANIEARNDFGHNALHYAAEKGFLEIVSLLIQFGANIEAKDQHGESALHKASGQGFLPLVEMLVPRIRDINERGGGGNTALHWASQYGHKEIAQCLIRNHSNINQRNAQHMTPLHLAILHGKKQLVDVLIGVNADILALDADSRSMLHLAAYSGEIEIIKDLISRAPLNVNQQDINGLTPLHYGIRRNDYTVVHFFIDTLHADLRLKTHNELDAMNIAVMEGNQRIIDLIRERLHL